MSPSREVAAAVGEAPAQGATELEQRAAALREVLSTPSEKEAAAVELAAVEAQLAAAREAQGRQAAVERQTGIKRGAGSKRDTYEHYVAALAAAAKSYAETAAALGDTYEDYRRFEAEDAALVDRFGVAPAGLPRLLAPDQHAAVIAAARLVHEVEYATGRRTPPATEKDGTGLRTRRTYDEVAGTPAHAIVRAVGLKPFPPSPTTSR
jgi:hypothetical protein